MGIAYNRTPRSGKEKVAEAEKEDKKSDAVRGCLGRVKTWEEVHHDREQEIRINAARFIIPDWLEINDWESNVLGILRQRLKMYSVDDSVWNELDKTGSETTAVSSDEEKRERPA